MSTPNKLTRHEVYALIDGERTYQNNLGSDRARGPLEPHSATKLTQAEFFTLLHVYLRRAEDAWTTNPGEYVEEAQANVRKLAAICVSSMEKYGAPKR